MAKVIWTEPALQTLDAIADCIALDNPAAASDPDNAVFDKTECLANF
jgi:plasmid stabilization system protein ParE